MENQEMMLSVICTHLDRIATALEAVAANQAEGPGWEVKGSPLDFDWGSYGVIATESDENGATVVRWQNHYWQRERAGNDWIYSRNTSNQKELIRSILIVFSN